MAYLTAGSGKSLSDESLEVYWDTLQQHSAQAFFYAAREALLQGKFPVFPAIGTLHEAATEFARRERRTAENKRLQVEYGPRPKEITAILNGIGRKP